MFTRKRLIREVVGERAVSKGLESLWWVASPPTLPGGLGTLEGYLAHKKTLPPRTLQ